jgi:ankyrin repeat protein
LAAALREGDVKLVRKMLRAGLKPHWCWVCETMRGGHLALAEMLLESGAERNVFTMAAVGDAAGLARRISRVRADARLAASMEPASQRVTPLHVACASDWRAHGLAHMAAQVQVAQTLKQYGARLNAPARYRGIDDATPLFCACWSSGNLALVHWLLDNGARAIDADLWAALGHFQRHGKEAYDIAEALLAWGLPVNGGVPGGRTPLHTFANQGTHRTVAWLLAHGADVNARGPSARTAAHFAAERNTGPRTLALLVESGADLAARDDDGHTPMEIAERNGKVRLVEWIARHVR